MKIETTKLNGVVILTPEAYKDERGIFFESFKKSFLAEHGLDRDWVQENHSASIRGVLRGLHCQKAPFEQTKLVRCVVGVVTDVCVDARKNSETFGQYVAVELSANNRKQLLLPKGCLHGFYVSSPTAEVTYKVDEYYNEGSDTTVLWNDSTLKIEWPVGNPILSKKDKKATPFQEFADSLS